MNIDKARELLEYDPVEGIARNRRTGKVNQRTLMLDGKKEYLNRVLYEIHHGPVGTGVVLFKDGDRNNFKLENLVLDTNKTAVVTRKASEYRETAGVREKSCTQCGVWLPVGEFTVRGDTGMPRGECPGCIKDRKHEYYSQSHRQRERRCNGFRRLYGISHADYDALLEKQSGGCAICGSTDPSGKSGRFAYFSIDHCHTTGAVRGLLCNHCNRGIGFLQDSPAIVAKALAYLTQGGTS